MNERDCAKCEFNAVEEYQDGNGDDIIQCWCEHGDVPTMNHLFFREQTPPAWCPLKFKEEE